MKESTRNDGGRKKKHEINILKETILCYFFFQSFNDCEFVVLTIEINRVNIIRKKN